MSQSHRMTSSMLISKSNRRVKERRKPCCPRRPDICHPFHHCSPAILIFRPLKCRFYDQLNEKIAPYSDVISSFSHFVNENNNNIGRNGSYLTWLASGYLIEERRRWSVITASPRGQCSKKIQNLEGKAFSDEGKPCHSPGRMKNSSYYIAPAGDRTHDLPHTVASNMGKVSHALTHSATFLAIHGPW